MNNILKNSLNLASNTTQPSGQFIDQEKQQQFAAPTGAPSTDQLQQQNISNLIGVNNQPRMATPVMPSQMATSLYGAPTESYKTGLAGISQMMAAGKEEAKARESYNQELQAINSQVNADYSNKLQESENFRNEQINKVRAASDEVTNFAAIDPNRYWNNQTTAQKISSSIAIMLGAIGGALQKTNKNLALEQIDRAIDRDIYEQERALQDKKGSLAAQQSLLGTYEKNIENINAAKLFAKRDQYQAAELKLNQMIAGSQSKEVQAKGLMMLSELQARKGQVNQEAMQMLMSDRALQMAESGEGFQTLAEIPKDLRDQAVKVGNRYQIATGKEVKKQLDEKLPAYKMQDQLGGEIISILKEGNRLSGFLPTEQRERLKTIAGQMITNMKSIDTLGTLDKGVENLIEKIIGNPNSIFTGNTEAKVNQYLTNLKQKQGNELQQSIVGYKRLK